MRRSTRIGATIGIVLLAGTLAWSLARIGSASSGPLTDALDAVGVAVSSAEQVLVEWVRGPGRESRLEWLAPYRERPDRLRQPDRVLLGAYEERIPASLEGVLALEDTLGSAFPLVHAYVAWGDLPRERFPDAFVRAVRSAGSIPVISWEPWLTDFERDRHSEIPSAEERPQGGLRAIADGTYDFYVDRWARKSVAYGDPILMRFGHEMNDPYRYPWGPQNNDPWDFVDAWRHVVQRFRAAGADNVLWVWSPHPAYGEFQTYYPGDEWVDWVGATALNYGAAAPWSRWWSFRETFGRYYDELAGFGKPILIAELGSLAVGGDRPAWYAEALDSIPSTYPAVKGIIFFASSSDATVTGKAVDWGIVGDRAVVRAIRRSLGTWQR